MTTPLRDHPAPTTPLAQHHTAINLILILVCAVAAVLFLWTRWGTLDGVIGVSLSVTGIIGAVTSMIAHHGRRAR